MNLDSKVYVLSTRAHDGPDKTAIDSAGEVLALQPLSSLHNKAPGPAHDHSGLGSTSFAVSDSASSSWSHRSELSGNGIPGTHNRENSTAGILQQGAEPYARKMELPPMDKGRQAWMFVASAFLLDSFVWGFGFTYGIFQAYYTANPPFNTASPAAISAIGTVALGIQYVEVVLFILWCKRYPDLVKKMMWACLALCFVGLFASSFATKVWQLIVLQGVFLGIGGGGLYTPVILWLSEWFSERRGLAGGIIFGGSGIGGFVFPLIISALLEKVGYRWTLRIWSIIMVVFAGLALLGARPRLPVVKPPGGRPPMLSNKYDFVKHPIFICAVLVIFTQSLGYFPVSLYMPTYVQALGRPVFDGTLVLSSFNAASVIGQIAFGHLCDRYPYTTVMIGSSIGSALAAFVLWGFARNLGMVLIFVIIFGSLSGGFTSTWPHASLASAGSDVNQAGIIFGVFGASKGISAIAGPLIAAALHQPQDSQTIKAFGNFGFGKIEIFVGAMMVASAVGGAVAAGIGRAKSSSVAGRGSGEDGGGGGGVRWQE